MAVSGAVAVEMLAAEATARVEEVAKLAAAATATVVVRLKRSRRKARLL